VQANHELVSARQTKRKTEKKEREETIENKVAIMKRRIETTSSNQDELHQTKKRR
jgi:hypothetical protein